MLPFLLFFPHIAYNLILTSVLTLQKIFRKTQASPKFNYKKYRKKYKTCPLVINLKFPLENTNHLKCKRDVKILPQDSHQRYGIFNCLKTSYFTFISLVPTHLVVRDLTPKFMGVGFESRSRQGFTKLFGVHFQRYAPT